MLEEDSLYENQLEEAKKKIDQGKRVLQNWRDLFKQTKQQIEDDGVDRWDFPCRAINERIPHMIEILRDLLDIADTLMKFLVFLGPNFKAVTENSAGIDSLVAEVKSLVDPFQSFEQNFFDKKNQSFWKNTKNKFDQQKQEIETKTIHLIHQTFKGLRSAEGAFDMLQNFKNVNTL